MKSKQLFLLLISSVTTLCATELPFPMEEDSAQTRESCASVQQEEFAPVGRLSRQESPTSLNYQEEDPCENLFRDTRPHRKIPAYLDRSMPEISALRRTEMPPRAASESELSKRESAHPVGHSPLITMTNQEPDAAIQQFDTLLVEVFEMLCYFAPTYWQTNFETKLKNANDFYKNMVRHTLDRMVLGRQPDDIAKLLSALGLMHERLCGFLPQLIEELNARILPHVKINFEPLFTHFGENSIELRAQLRAYCEGQGIRAGDIPGFNNKFE